MPDIQRSAFSHTPGPWKWQGDDNDLVAPALYEAWVQSDYNAAVCPFVLQGEWHNDSTAGVSVPNQANARLIALAPAMFDLVRTIVAICDSGNTNLAQLACMETSPLVDEARALIASVEGA